VAGAGDRRGDLSILLSALFFATIRLQVEGEGGESLGQRGDSQDHHADLKQMVGEWS